jgi:hypothetical protein
MPDVPAACQGIANELTSLQAQAHALATQAEAQNGAAAWQTLAKLGQVHAEEAAKRQEFDACTSASAAPLTGTLTVIDVRPDPPAETRSIMLWDVADPPAAAVTADLQGPAFGFPDPLPQRRNVSVQSVAGGVALGVGFDFRTGELGATTKSLPIELLLLPDVMLDQAKIAAWASSVIVPAQQVVTGDGQVIAPVEVGPTTFSVTLANGLFMVIAYTTVAATQDGMVPLPSTPTPMSVTLPVTVLPDMNPLGDPAAPLKVTLGDPVVTQDGALFSGLAAPLAPIVIGFVRSHLEQQLAGWINGQLPALVAAAFAIDGLPDGCTISVRALGLTDDRLTLTAFVGDVGNALATFTPQHVEG